MNQILEILPPDTAQAILANAVSTLLPDPGLSVARHREHDGVTVLRDRVVSEVRRHLKIPADDNSPEAQERIISTLATLMNDLILASEPESEIRKRLARKWLLPRGQYEISLEDSLRGGIGSTTQPEQIKDAIQHPSVEAHYSANGLSEMKNSAFSITLKRYGKQRTQKSYTLLVVWVADAGVKRVTAAWRIYDREVPHSIDWSPLKVLQAFLDVFGCEFRLLKREPTRLMLFDKVILPNAVRTIRDLMQFVAVNEGPKGMIEEFAKSKFDRGLSVENVDYFFIVDATHYAVTMRRHGIEVPRKYLP